MGWFFAGEELKTKWNEFVISNGGSFLQSWEWGEFQKKAGRKIWPLIYEENDETQAAALIIRHDLPFGFGYLYCPRPVINSQLTTHNSQLFKEFSEKVKEIGEKEKAVFFKIEPEADFPFNLADFGFVKSEKEIQPSQTVILDLAKTEEELLAEMKPKTRYNINLAERKGVKMANGKWQMANGKFERFWELMKETAGREGFRLHEKSYYENLLASNSPNFSAELFLAEYNEKTIAAHLVIFFGKQAIYLHGASSREHKETMALYLLHWQAIKQAKSRGCPMYDFWGISEKKWPGLTRFKKSFGGFEKTYPGAFDFVFDKFLYGWYNVIRRII